MILDRLLTFTGTAGSGTAITDSPTTGATESTNVIDWHIAGLPVLASGDGARDMGIGDNPALKLLVQVTTTFTSGGAGTLSVALQGAQDNGSGAPGSYTTWWLSPTYALATLVAGARLYDMDFPRPPAGVAIPRFVRMLFTIATADMTAGAIYAGIVLDRMDQPYKGTSNAIMGGYPAGITVAN